LIVAIPPPASPRPAHPKGCTHGSLSGCGMTRPPGIARPNGRPPACADHQPPQRVSTRRIHGSQTSVPIRLKGQTSHPPGRRAIAATAVPPARRQSPQQPDPKTRPIGAARTLRCARTSASATPSRPAERSWMPGRFAARRATRCLVRATPPNRSSRPSGSTQNPRIGSPGPPPAHPFLPLFIPSNSDRRPVVAGSGSGVIGASPPGHKLFFAASGRPSDPPGTNRRRQPAYGTLSEP